MVEVPPNAVAHASARLAQLILAVVRSDVDPRTLAGWASLCNLGYWTLRERCRCAGVAPRTALSFARVLRAVLLAERGLQISESLDVEDPRALLRLLVSGGVGDLYGRSFAIEEFLDAQRFVRIPKLVDELRRQGIGPLQHRSVGRSRDSDLLSLNRVRRLGNRWMAN